MLHRKFNDGILIITQPAHSWVSGQLARAWGNEEFPAFAPWEEVCLASGLHDVGFLEWELAPSLNLATGWPHSFLEIPTELRLKIWTEGVRKLSRLNRYAALLSSLHYTGLAERNRVTEPREKALLQERFLTEQDALQAEWRRSLQQEPFYAPFTSPERLEQNRRFIASWDWMSLVLGMGAHESVTIEDVPGQSGLRSFQMLRLGAHTEQWRVTPWPFRLPAVELRVEARFLRNRFSGEPEMQQVLRTAPVHTLSITLTP